MAENAQPQAQGASFGYGYEDDNIKQSTYSFGGNFGKTFLTKFEFTPNGGKDGAAQDALEIAFDINGTERSYRQFPVTKAFDENNNEVTDPAHPAMQEAMKNLNQIITQILKCFRDEADVKAAFQTRITSFKEFCEVAMKQLPSGYSGKPLDIFMQYQWQPTGTNTRTYLEIPKKIRYGKFLCAAIPGNWKEVRDAKDGLFYINEAGEKHPFFSRTTWFLESNFAKPQSEGSDVPQTQSAGTPAAGAAGTPAAGTTGGW